MVFFTCNHCGDAVKKPAVDKHYNTKCRNNKKSVSCMDCLKDFQDNYVEHIKCITEMQKYSGKDYVPRESQNSGAKKQESWTSVVHTILDSPEYNLTEKTRKAFEMLQNYDNVPRKKAKFLNFVSNSVHIPRQTVEEVWNILDKEQEKMKQIRQAELEAAKKQKESAKTENIPVDNSESNVIEPQQNGLPSDTKSKKTKKSNKEQVEIQNGETTHGDCLAEDSKKKKKKHKETELQQHNDLENGVDQEVAEMHELDNSASKSKKKQKKQLIEPVELVENSSEKKKRKAAAAEDINSDSPQEKKQKIMENGSSLVESDRTAHKKMNGAVAPKKPQENGENVYQFCWDTELERIVGKHPEGITLEKLKKKILKKFKTKLSSDELTERQQKGFDKKFNKKLNKSIAVKKDGELVKTCS